MGSTPWKVELEFSILTETCIHCFVGWVSFWHFGLPMLFFKKKKNNKYRTQWDGYTSLSLKSK